MPRQVRRGPVSKDQPSSKVQAATKLPDKRIIPTSRQALDEARLVAQIEKQLGIVRCCDCGRRLHILRSILAGRGPVCLKRPGGVT